MTGEELEKAVNKLIAEANAESASAKKEYEKDCLAEKYHMLSRRTYRSCVLENALALLKEEYDALVQKIQDDLNESLDALYAENGGGSGPSGDIDPSEAPYEVDYTLPMNERYIVVKDYYLSIADKGLALRRLEQDDIAKDYLGTYYDYLVQLLLMLQT